MEYTKCGEEKFLFEPKICGKQCQICKNELPIVTLTTQKLKLCKNCFNRILQNRVKKAVEKYKMFSKEDRIGVFISGGKDSSSLLSLLKNTYPEAQIYGIYLNLGIRYYSDYVENIVKTLCEKLNTPLYIYNLPKEENVRIDDFIFTKYKNKICAVCGTIKRNLFSKIAKKLNLSVIATGHNLDDITSILLTLFFQGEFDSLAQLYPVLPPITKGQAKKIKPLCLIPEKELFYYAVLNEIPVERCSCPHGEITPSKKVKYKLEVFEQENKNFKYQLFSVFFKKLIPMLRNTKKQNLQVFNCTKCGELTSSNDKICSSCKKIELVNKIENKKLEISKEELKNILQTTQKDCWKMFDLRLKENYEQNHIEDAIWVPPEILQKGEKEIYKFFKNYKTKNILLYCYSGRLSYLLTLKLRKMNFKAYNLEGGISEHL